MNVHVGTSGYYYNHWKGIFYHNSRYLDTYADYFDSLEINNTFYRLPSKKTVDKWIAYDLDYCFKVSRYFRSFVKNDIQKAKASWKLQYKSLRSLAKRSVFLLQFDANTIATDQLIDNIRKCIPKSVKLVIEGRNDSWTSGATLDKLTSVKIPLVVLPKNGIFNMNVSKVLDQAIKNGIVYIRFHGITPYGGNYSNKMLKHWSDIIKSLGNIEVYCFFNNDENAYSVKNALTMIRYLDN